MCYTHVHLSHACASIPRICIPQDAPASDKRLICIHHAHLHSSHAFASTKRISIHHTHLHLSHSFTSLTLIRISHTHSHLTSLMCINDMTHSLRRHDSFAEVT